MAKVNPGVTVHEHAEFPRVDRYTMSRQDPSTLDQKHQVRSLPRIDLPEHIRLMCEARDDEASMVLVDWLHEQGYPEADWLVLDPTRRSSDHDRLQWRDRIDWFRQANGIIAPGLITPVTKVTANMRTIFENADVEVVPLTGVGVHVNVQGYVHPSWPDGHIYRLIPVRREETGSVRECVVFSHGKIYRFNDSARWTWMVPDQEEETVGRLRTGRNRWFVTIVGSCAPLGR